MLDTLDEAIRALGGDPDDRAPDAEWAALEAKAAKKWDRMTPAELVAARSDVRARSGRPLPREADVREAFIDAYCVERWGRAYREEAEAERVERARVEAERVKGAVQAAKASAAAPLAATARATRPATATEAAAPGADRPKRQRGLRRGPAGSVGYQIGGRFFPHDDDDD